ncbi:MAG: TonB-dependent receptor plug domain-containing protein [Gemmatimonadaceae bacterium]
MLGIAVAVPAQQAPPPPAVGPVAAPGRVPGGRDSPRREDRGDPMPPAALDSLRDTIKAPLAVAPRGAMPELRGRRTVWDREAILADGAVTLPELLADVPGFTAFYAGFIAAPTAAAWYGGVGRVRVFFDGVEWDALDPREQGTRDLATIPIWSLEEVAVERLAGELRVHLRSWRVIRTTPQTRTDILTGSEQVNLYRGFYGKRTDGGGVVQVAAQQFSTTSVRTRGDGDALSAFGRVGMARGRLSVDAVVHRIGRIRRPLDRYVVSGTLQRDAIGRFEGDDALGYLRAVWGSPDSTGLWMQAIAAGVRHQEVGDTTAGADTAVAQTQYLVAAGGRRWGLDLSGQARLRIQGGEQRLATAIRAGWQSRWAQVGAFAETGGPDSTARLDLTLAAMPWRWLQLVAAHSLQSPSDSAVGGPIRTTSRLEVAATLWQRTLSAGVVQQSAQRIRGVPIFDPRFAATEIGGSTGLEVGLAGPIRGPFFFAWRGVRWQEEAPYRPQVESRAELRVSTGFERQIVRRTFHLSAAFIHEYRGPVSFPLAGGGVLRTEGAGVYGSILDMRIGSAHVFWHNRNALGQVFETVPGFLMPRLVQLYGVRWEFWN